MSKPKSLSVNLCLSGKANYCPKPTKSLFLQIRSDGAGWGRARARRPSKGVQKVVGVQGGERALHLRSDQRDAREKGSGRVLIGIGASLRY